VDAWYLDSGQGAQGPYKIGELVALWRSDRISWNAKLWREGDPEWSPARGHGAFIDAIFAHDERARAEAAGLPEASKLSALAASSLPLASAVAKAREQTTPSFPAQALTGAVGAVGAVGADVVLDPRTPHDSLAPFERASQSHAPAPRWPYAMVLASAAIAVGGVVWAVRMPPGEDLQAAAASVAAVEAEPRPTAVPAAAAIERGPAVAATAERVPGGATVADDALAPAGALDPSAARSGAAQVAPDFAARTAPGASPGRAPAIALSPKSAAAPEDRARLQQEHAAAEALIPDDGTSGAETSAGPEQPAAPAPALDPDRPRGPDFMTAAEPLPDLPTTREIASAVRTVAPAVRACASALGPTTVYVTVAISGPTGRVARVQVPSVSSELQRCIAGAVRTASFPRFERPELELRFPFLIGG
jgi:hypothetical protein